MKKISILLLLIGIVCIYSACKKTNPIPPLDETTWAVGKVKETLTSNKYGCTYHYDVKGRMVISATGQKKEIEYHDKECIESWYSIITPFSRTAFCQN